MGTSLNQEKKRRVEIQGDGTGRNSNSEPLQRLGQEG